MKKAQHKLTTKNAAWFWLMLAIVLLPNWYFALNCLFTGQVSKLAPRILLGFFAMVLVALPAVLFQFKPKTYAIILSPWLLAAPWVMLNIYREDAFPSHWMLITTYQDANDVLELAVDFWWMLLAIAVLFVAFIVWANTVFSKNNLPLSRLWLIPILGTMAAYALKDKSVQAFASRIDAVFPTNSVYDIVQATQDDLKLRNREAALQHFSFGALRPNAYQGKEIYVLVIGETSRYGNWSLNGYHRKTTPNLDAMQKEMVVFSNMAASASVTTQSLPLLMTRTQAQDFDQAYEKRSFIQLFKETGFTTYWLSNAHRWGEHDTNTSIYAHEADTVVFNDKNEANEKYRLDETLISLFEQYLSFAPQKSFFVIHLLGSHYKYARRYPDRFDIFTPSAKDDEPFNAGNKQDLLKVKNSYDNSIAYTDYVVAELIHLLENTNQKASLFFIADHGENLFDQGTKNHLHGYANYYDLHIPCFAWFSSISHTTDSASIAILHSNRATAASFYNLQDSFSDWAGIGYTSYDSSLSLFKKSYKPRPRQAINLKGKVVDVDNIFAKATLKAN